MPQGWPRLGLQPDLNSEVHQPRDFLVLCPQAGMTLEQAAGAAKLAAQTEGYDAGLTPEAWRATLLRQPGALLTQE